MKRIVLALSGSLLVTSLAGCGGGASHASSAPPTTAGPGGGTATSSPTTAPPPADPTTTVPIDTSVVPPRITPAYVNAVFARLDHVLGDSIRTILATGEISPKTQLQLSSIYSPAQYKIEAQIFTKVFALKDPGLRPHPGDPAVSVVRLETVSPTCIFLRANTDLSREVRSGLPTVHHDFYELTPATAQQRQLGNPTPWVIAGSAQVTSDTSVQNPCG